MKTDPAAVTREGRDEVTQEWQPIETAPKGTPVLVRTHPHYRAEGQIVVADSRDGVSWWTRPGRYSVGATHWMPLPDPPPLSASTPGGD